MQNVTESVEKSVEVSVLYDCEQRGRSSTRQFVDGSRMFREIRIHSYSILNINRH